MAERIMSKPERIEDCLRRCASIDPINCNECWYRGLRNCKENLLQDVMILIENIKRTAAQPKWISVDADQKPQHGKEYLCVCSLPDDPKHEWDWIMVLRWYAYGTNGYVDRPHFTDEGLNGMIVTHWMERPKLPKEEAK